MYAFGLSLMLLGVLCVRTHTAARFCIQMHSDSLKYQCRLHSIEFIGLPHAPCAQPLRVVAGAIGKTGSVRGVYGRAAVIGAVGRRGYRKIPRARSPVGDAPTAGAAASRVTTSAPVTVVAAAASAAAAAATAAAAAAADTISAAAATAAATAGAGTARGAQRILTRIRTARRRGRRRHARLRALRVRGRLMERERRRPSGTAGRRDVVVRHQNLRHAEF